MAKLTKIILVDDHPIIREGMRTIIEREPDLTICAEAEDAHDALTAVEASKPHLAIVDLSLKSTSGFNLIQDLKAFHPELIILVLSMYDEMTYAERVIRAGALGYITKQNATDNIVEAIRHVLQGQIYVSEAVSAQLFQQMVDGKLPASDNPTSALSDRELQVYQLLGEGKSPRQIAEILTLSVKTVESHIERIKAKLNVGSGRELTRQAMEWVIRSEH
ncbi:MAG: response regulator transcription factor [Bacteroidota bacterium]